MTMEKGMSSGEGLPSRSSQVSAVKVTAKDLEAKQSHKEKRGGFVLVHAGAGYHSESKAKEYKHVCKRACQKAIEKLQAGALATDAVTAALVELEVYTHSLHFMELHPAKSPCSSCEEAEKITSPKNFYLLTKGNVS